MGEYKLGLIGAGNMARAIIAGAIGKNVIGAGSVFVCDIDENKLKKMTAELGVGATKSAPELVISSDIVILAVKPNVLGNVLLDIKDAIGDKPMVSIAAGWSAAKIKGVAGNDKKVLRLMPNTPLMVGEGMTVFEAPSNLEAAEQAFVESVFAALGQIEHASTELMDAVTAVSGSGPAYGYMFIEALAAAGVKNGLPADSALKLATQTALGAAKMVAETGEDPGALKDAVCSPGGTTIQAVKSLEEDGFYDMISSAVGKAAARSKELAE